MFAVPGWSVSADKLKTESAEAPSGAPTPKSKKRKRSAGTLSVTPANVADLWGRIIERKAHETSDTSDGKRQTKTAKRRRKHEATAVGGHLVPPGQTLPVGGDHQPEKSTARGSKADRVNTAASQQRGEPSKTHGGQSVRPPSKEARREGKKERRPQGRGSEKKTPGGDAHISRDEQDQEREKPTTTEPAKLTPLQASMREKLVSARFRHLNETLYTRPSAEAFQLFQDSPEMFDEYHSGFRRQVDVWPENPVDGYVRDIQSRGRVKPAPRARPSRPGGPVPLPRTDGTCTIADLGCGDARLAGALQSHRKKLRLELLSYDLQSRGALVTRADIANLPLGDGSVDVAVFCLALMGTNWLDFVEEAYRVLRWKGELWVAEIKSRFGAVRDQRGPVDHSVGNRKKQAGGGGGKKPKSKDAAVDEADEVDLAVEVDGADDRRHETDVSAFVEALRKRGFVLRGDPKEAVDLSNKMFVKMAFLKAAPAVRGKAAVQIKGAADGHVKKFIPVVEEREGPEKEGAILKPCVYKLR